MLKEFKEFAMRGNVVDMAVGIVIGAAFGKIVSSFVNDVLMPPIGLLFGGANFENLFMTLKEGAKAGPYPTLADAQAAGAVTMNLGVFINTVISFLIVAFAIFMVIKGINQMRREQEAPPAEPTTKECSLSYDNSHSGDPLWALYIGPQGRFLKKGQMGLQINWEERPPTANRKMRYGGGRGYGENGSDYEDCIYC